MNHNDSNELEQGIYGPHHAAAHPQGGEIWVRPARSDEIASLRALIATEISQDVGSLDAMQQVFAKNPFAFWCIERREPIAGQVSAVGMYGFLPLNERGAEALRSGTLDGRKPDLAFIAPAGTKPAALYVWALVAKGIGRLTYPLIKQAIGTSYWDVPVFAIPATRGGTKAVTDRGFAPLGGPDHGQGRLAMLTSPRELSLRPDSGRQFEVLVASTAEHLQMSAFIRGATFGAEQRCPYFEEFDGNDYCAMHLIGLVDGEPAATLRIRFFASFAKLERLAVIERHRKTPLKNLVMEKAIEITRLKGYTTLYGQSQERLVGFYARFGFRPLRKNRKLAFSDHNYVEIVRNLPHDPDSITIESDPYLIIRPEGRWNMPGVLEASAARPATNPV